MPQYQDPYSRPFAVVTTDTHRLEGTTHPAPPTVSYHGRLLVSKKLTPVRLVDKSLRRPSHEKSAPRLEVSYGSKEETMVSIAGEQSKAALRGIGARYKPGFGLGPGLERMSGNGMDSENRHGPDNKQAGSFVGRSSFVSGLGAAVNSRNSSGCGSSTAAADKPGFKLGLGSRLGTANKRESCDNDRLTDSIENIGVFKHDRPVISGPLGPVRRSMGSDLERGENFTIVPSIESCVGPQSSGARRISASFPHGGPLSSNPTVASSTITATVEITNASAHHLQQNENVPPSADSSFTSQTPVLKQRIPKSRTMNIFSNITASISRPSLSSLSGNVRTSSSASISSAVAPEPNVLQIHTAQPSAYWTGRFTALHDRFHAEQLQAQYLSSFLAGQPSKISLPSHRLYSDYTRPSFLPASTTTIALSTLTAPSSALEARRQAGVLVTDSELQSDEDNRYRRVFLHLEGMCANSEARMSLHAWQQAYARRVGRETLLPRGGTMEKGIVARFFSNGRRSIGGIPTKKIVIGSGARGGKRMSIL